MTDLISSLLPDLADELRDGGELDALIAAYAVEFDVRADVLRARFARAFPNGVPARVNMTAKVRDAVAATCARYGVPVDATRTGVDRHGVRYTLIGRFNNRVAVTVDHATARVWNSPLSRFDTTARLGLVK